MSNYEQIIYFGAPGTGKSHHVENNLINQGISEHKIFRTTIHPEYSYSDFIGQLLPYTDPSDSSKVRYTFKKGVFTEAMVEAYSDSTKRVYLILEELSRGNVSAIFGDIFQLLDRNIHFESRYSIVNKDIANEIIAFPGDRIKIPSNLNIIGTVNTNDQSVFPMDTAFKRRFDWRYISSEPAKDEHGSRIKKLNNPKLFIPIDANRSNDIETNWQSFYMVLNDYITDKQLGLGKNEDKQVGQFFIQFSSELIDKSYSSSSVEEQEAREIINNKIRSKLLLYLWQDVESNIGFTSNKKLFSTETTSFDTLYSTYKNHRVYSQNFIEFFTIKGYNNYPEI